MATTATPSPREVLLAASREDILADFFRLTREADAARELETASAVRMQADWRGHVVRRLLTEWNSNALHIERIYRGHLGRVKARAAHRERSIFWQEIYFSACATVLQKWFRGYHSRRYKHNYHARKAYIAAVLSKSEALRGELQERLQEQVETEIAEQERKARSDVDQLSAKLHHLVSTKTTPGIYNSPMHDGFLPTAFSIPVEQHLRNAVKPVIREQMRNKGKVTNTKPKLDILRSVPGADPYISQEERDRQGERSNRLGFVGGNFTSAMQSGNQFAPHHASIQANSMYIDGGTQTLGRSTDKKSWVSSKPFHTAVARNKLVETSD